MQLSFSIEVGELRRALAILGPVTKRYASLPALGCVHVWGASLASTEAPLGFEATDLESRVALRPAVTLHCHTPQASALLPAANLRAIVKAAPKRSAIRFDCEPCPLGMAVAVSFAGETEPSVRFTAPNLSEWPEMVAPEPVAWASLPADALLLALDSTVPSSSEDETRYNLNGVYFDPDRSDGHLPAPRVVATDGHRLALCELPIPAGDDGWGAPFILPRAAADDWRRCLKAAPSGAGVSFGADGPRLALRIDGGIGGVECHARAIDGDFPQYRNVLAPVDQPRVRLSVDPAEALAALAAFPINRKGSSPVKLTLNGEAVLSREDPDGGSIRRTLPSMTLRSVGLPAGCGPVYNVPYLIAALRAVSGGATVEWSLADGIDARAKGRPAKANVSPCELSDGNGRLAAVMPMRQ